jgi:RND family efflux transporter MFP subunit
MFAQANSEHCRHKIFNASWRIDGLAQPQSLFAMIRATHAANPQGTLVAYSDNSSVIAGTVVERSAVVGAPVSPMDVLFRIADLSSLWLVANIPETQLRQVRRGQPVKVTLDALPDITVDGRVSFVADAVRSDTRTVDVRVVVPNADGRLKPGMFARVRIETGATNSPSVSGVVIPGVAVQRLAGATVVFVQTGPREFTARPIAAEETAGGQVLVVDGLNPGEVVVTRGSFILKAEAVRGQSGESH